MKCTTLLASAGILALSASGALAASVGFNESNNWTTGNLSYTGSDGMGVTANGKTYNSSIGSGGDVSNAYAASWSGANGGIGVCSGNVVNQNTPDNYSSNCHNDSHTVDGSEGSGSDEGVLFTFDHVVKILSITFAYSDENDQYDFDVSMGASAGPGLDAFDLSAYNGVCTNPPGGVQEVCTVTNVPGLYGTQFLIGAYYNSSSYKIQSMTYEKKDMDVVPLPAAGWLMLAGFGGLAAMKRRKR